MTKTLVIIPTKDRAEPLNCLIQNLIMQPGEFDVYIADMSTDEGYLYNNWYVRAGLERLKHLGHNYVVMRVSGPNQLSGYQAGLDHAVRHGYELCLGGDDDLTYDIGFIEKGVKYMNENVNCGVLVGYTFYPWMALSEQTAPQEFVYSDQYDPPIERMGTQEYLHCILYNPDMTSPREFNVVFGGFFFRVSDAMMVGGFPKHISKFGFRGEMMLQMAISFLGRKQVLNPDMVSWHYSNPTGGLRTIQGDFKQKCIDEDLEKWRKFVARRTPSTSEVI